MGENFNYDFRTPLQKQQDERKKNIIAMFADFRAKAPAETSDSSITACWLHPAKRACYPHQGWIDNTKEETCSRAQVIKSNQFKHSERMKKFIEIITSDEVISLAVAIVLVTLIFWRA